MIFLLVGFRGLWPVCGPCGPPLDANYRQCGWWRSLALVRRLFRVDEMHQTSVWLLHLRAAPGLFVLNEGPTQTSVSPPG